MIEPGMSLRFPGQGNYRIVSADPELCTDYDFETLAAAREALEDWGLDMERMDEDCLPVIESRRGRTYLP
jgi:hypothetical protein